MRLFVFTSKNEMLLDDSYVTSFYGTYNAVQDRQSSF